MRKEHKRTFNKTRNEADMNRKFIMVLGIVLVLLSLDFYPANALFETTTNQEQNKAVSEQSIRQLLEIAVQPVGKTMYVWGGGWNEEDTAAGIEARSIGVSEQWEIFFKKQNKKYDFNKTRYQIHNGLDCSGYVGWTMYNFLHHTDGEEGYVMKAEKMAKDFAQRGWGKYIPAKSVKDYKPGDIMSNKTHVYMVIGSCSDGSVVLVHASPPGVQINGTVNAKGSKNSQASKLANQYMKTYYPKWYEKFKPKVLDKSYLKNYNQMRWDIHENSLMKDEERVREMKADEVLQMMYGVKENK